MVVLGVIANVVLTSLSAGASASTELAISVKPASAVIFVDGIRRGSASKTRTIRLSPGVHVVRVVNSKDEHEEPVRVTRGKKTTWSWEFEDDKRNDVPVVHREARASAAPVVDVHRHSEDANPERADSWLLPVSQEAPSTELQQSGARRRAAHDRLAAMPQMPSLAPAASPRHAARGRHQIKARHHAS
jgi:hypothetical protein